MSIVDYFQSMYSMPDGYMFKAKWRNERIHPRNDPYFHIHKNRDNNIVFDSGFWRCWVKLWLAQNWQVQCYRNNKGLTALPLEGTADDLPIPIREAENSDWQNRNSPRDCVHVYPWELRTHWDVTAVISPWSHNMSEIPLSPHGVEPADFPNLTLCHKFQSSEMACTI